MVIGIGLEAMSKMSSGGASNPLVLQTEAFDDLSMEDGEPMYTDTAAASPDVADIDGGEYTIIVQDGVTKKVLLSVIKEYLL